MVPSGGILPRAGWLDISAVAVILDAMAFMQ
jgi:hypothetical protein